MLKMAKDVNNKGSIGVNIGEEAPVAEVGVGEVALEDLVVIVVIGLKARAVMADKEATATGVMTITATNAISKLEDEASISSSQVAIIKEILKIKILTIRVPILEKIQIGIMNTKTEDIQAEAIAVTTEGKTTEKKAALEIETTSSIKTIGRPIIKAEVMPTNTRIIITITEALAEAENTEITPKEEEETLNTTGITIKTETTEAETASPSEAEEVEAPAAETIKKNGTKSHPNDDNCSYMTDFAF